MTIAPDIIWKDLRADARGRKVLATKLHVLHLESIKEKLGDKWERLSGLVHKLFEKSLGEVQGPADHFLLTDELSYVVTFHALSVEEATVACACVARKVCELLFGAEIDEIAVRAVVGQVPSDLVQTDPADHETISEILERQGREIVITPKSAAPAPAERSLPMRWQPIERISKAHTQATRSNIALGFFPVWDLKNRRSASLFFSPFTGPDRTRIGIRRALQGAPEGEILQSEIALLNGAAAYAQRVHAAQKMCALGVGVSYETLSGFHSRIRYIGALKAVPLVPTCPLVLRIEQIPEGVLMGRLAEIVTMLSMPHVRITLDFDSLWRLPDFNVRSGAAGFGGSLRSYDSNSAAVMMNKLARRAAEQHAFVFLHDIDSEDMLALALQNGVRFGSGLAVGGSHCFTGQEGVPAFPLQYD